VEQLTVRRVRQIIAEILACREIDPPAGFVQLQIARLSEAMIVARTMMGGAAAPRRAGEGPDGKNGGARKWCRNGLKRLNQRPEMVWSRMPGSHNI